MKRWLLVVVGLLAVAACGGTSPAPFPQRRTVIGTLWNDASTWILVGPNRHALYIFCVERPVHCPGRQDPDYPPLLARGRVVAGPPGSRFGENDHVRVSASGLGTVELKNGERQVTYHGDRLYTYRGDHKPGNIDIRGTHYSKRDGGEWDPVDASRGGTAIVGVY